MQLVDAIKDQNIGIGLHLDFDDNVTDFTKETYNQLGTFKDVFQKTPHHIDIHKNPPADEAMKNIVDLCDNLDIPLRNRGDGFLAKKHTQGVRYVASRKTSDEVRSRLSSIAENESSEIVFHPGKYDPNSASTLNREREDDVKMIEFINDILHDMGIHRISTQDLYAI